MSEPKDLPLRTHIPDGNQETIHDSQAAGERVKGAHKSTTEQRPASPKEKEPDEPASPSEPERDNESDAEQQGKYGFIIYRTGDTSDEARWSRFMKYLNAQVHARLEDYDQTEDIPLINWNVQTSTEFDSCGFDTIREHFKAWIRSGAEEDDMSSRFDACLVVDEAVLASVDATLETGEPIDEFDTEGCAWVYLVSRREKEGETRLGISFVPRAYELLENVGWEVVGKKSGVSLP